jgi:hypothetical protein
MIDKNQWGELNPKHTNMILDYLQDVKENKTSHYMLTIARDGEMPVRSIIYYDNAIDAVTVYESYKDWGFAKDFLTVCLYEPNGQVHEKVLKRPPGLEASFMRQNYIEVAEVILAIKNYLNPEIYEELVLALAEIFAKDNKRFNEIRFLQNTKYFN